MFYIATVIAIWNALKIFLTVPILLLATRSVSTATVEIG